MSEMMPVPHIRDPIPHIHDLITRLRDLIYVTPCDHCYFGSEIVWSENVMVGPLETSCVSQVPLRLCPWTLMLTY